LLRDAGEGGEDVYRIGDAHIETWLALDKSRAGYRGMTDESNL